MEMEQPTSEYVLGGCGQPMLLECSLDFLDGPDLVRTIGVSSLWKSVASSDAVWGKQCQRLWRDKVFVPETLRSTSSCSRIRAYWDSITDARREHITEEELCSLTWYCRMKGWAGENWTNSDPWWQGKPASTREFNADGTTYSVDRGPGAWRFVKDSSGRTGPWGSFVRMSRGGRDFPTHFVSRFEKNWGWILQNCWGFSASFPLPHRGEDEVLEDDGPVCQQVTVEKCFEEAQRFNFGQRLPYEDGADESDDASEEAPLLTVPPGVDEDEFLQILRNTLVRVWRDRARQQQGDSPQDGASQPGEDEEGEDEEEGSSENAEAAEEAVAEEADTEASLHATVTSDGES